MNKIRQFRLQAHMTQAQLAQGINKSIACISQYENGVHIPPIPVAKRIAKIVGCEWSELYEGD